ncbi:MAG: UDP-N-acetylmuramoyl-tripeptide--D-alanyl-D-alanine ligase [Patescibacteria group bacterium]
MNLNKFFRRIIFYLLALESRLVIWKYKPKIVAITGSVGKTSTKDAVYRVLSGEYYVRKSEKSYNSEIGLPLTVLGLPNGWNDISIWLSNFLKGLRLILFPSKYPTWLVLEVGTGKPGDIKRTAGWLRADAVVVTAIGETPVHVEFFPSKQHLVEEKSELVKTLKPDGVLLLNADDADVLGMKEKTKGRVFTYGWGPADIVASGESIHYDSVGIPDGLVFRVDANGKSLPVEVDGVFGKNHISAALAALGLATALKLNLLEAVERLKNYEFAPGRMRSLPGAGGSLIIDDTYNSSPLASYAALGTLGEIKIDKTSGRKIAVLADMLELGKHTEEAHKNVGEVARERADVVISVGPRSKAIGAEHHFSNSREAGEFLKTFIKKGDIVLVKGSQSMRMERVVEAILDPTVDKLTHLVRQEPEWLKRA